MTKKENKEEYKKPELINIDDPTFDEKGLGSSGSQCPAGKIGTSCPSNVICSGGGVSCTGVTCTGGTCTNGT